LCLVGEGIGVYTLRRHFIEVPNGSRKELKERRSRMNLIALKTFETALLETIIETSLLIKQNPCQYADVLKNKSLYMLFEKTSTRTALAFGLGFNELGGRYFIQRWQDSNFVVGEIPDETRYVARNVDIILARLKRNKIMGDVVEKQHLTIILTCDKKALCHDKPD
jgi:ornithine carbamoyltransferase